MVVVLSEWLFFHSRAETTIERQDGEADQRADLPLRGGLGEQAKSCARVLHVGELEKAGDHHHAVVQRNVAGDRPFGQPVQQAKR